MRRVIWLLIIIWLVLVLTACNGAKWCAKRYPPEVFTRTDSFIQTEYRDTVVFVDGAVIRDTFRVECDSAGQVVITGGNGSVKYVYRDRWLTVSAECPDTAIIIPRYKQVVKVSRERSDVVQVRQRYIPWWVKALAWCGAGALVAVAGRAGWHWFMQSV